MDDSDVDTAATRRVSKAEYKKFDGWPWGGGGSGGSGKNKKNKRRSLPLTRVSLDEAKKGVAEKAFGGVFKRESHLGPLGTNAHARASTDGVTFGLGPST